MRSAPARELCNDAWMKGSANPHGACIARRSHHIDMAMWQGDVWVGYSFVNGIDACRSMGLPFSLCIQIVVVNNGGQFLWITTKSALHSWACCMQNRWYSVCPDVDDWRLPPHDTPTTLTLVPTPSTGEPQTAHTLCRWLSTAGGQVIHMTRPQRSHGRVEKRCFWCRLTASLIDVPCQVFHAHDTLVPRCQTCFG